MTTDITLLTIITTRILHVTTLLSDAIVVITPLEYLNTKHKVQYTQARHMEEFVNTKGPVSTIIECSS